MPKVCIDCPFRETKYDPGYYYYEKCNASGRIFNEYRLDINPFEEKLNDCPLVEIVTCGECKHWHEGEWYNTCDKHIGHGFIAEHFCSDGERRTK